MTPYHKLVRDGIPDLIRGKGESCTFHIASEQEYAIKLAEKLREETEEFLHTPNAEELADILEVLEAFLAMHNLTWNQVRQVQEEKRAQRGGFSKKYILEQS